MQRGVTRTYDLSWLAGWFTDHVSWEILMGTVLLLWKAIGPDRRRKVGLAVSLSGLFGGLALPAVLGTIYLGIPQGGIGAMPMLVLSTWKIDDGYEYSSSVLQVIVEKITEKFSKKQ